MLKELLARWPNFFCKQPIDKPTEAELKHWASSEWIEYQAWLFHHGFLTQHDWEGLRTQALSWQKRPLISIITPVFNTRPLYLQACIYSVQTQAYPDWEMCLVDDGSEQADTIACLETLVAEDARLHLHRFSDNQGICEATNHALAMARGEYVAFLDHDDRLAPDALYWVVETLRNHPETDIIYSDRDSLSPNDFRLMHLFKPDWAPETLLSGNYLFHLMVYRRALLEELGGVRASREGSQDYDLILRAAEKTPTVQHIPKVLYHWRQHEQSVAMAHNVKEYAYIAGVEALSDALKRRGLIGKVSENKALWRGHYRIRLKPPLAARYQVLQLTALEDYALQINRAFESDRIKEYLVILGPSVKSLDDEAVTELLSWLQVPDVGMVTGKVLDIEGNFLHAGLIQRPEGVPLAVYCGYPENTPGYMAVTAIVRNVSTPHPACCVVERALWQRLGGLNSEYTGPYALLDFALRALKSGIRTVYTPFARFMASDWQSVEIWEDKDRVRFVQQWENRLKQGDPYYNPYLTLELLDMGIDLKIKR
jgi:O-antigen biosynthesis protein